jgi:hypothetical protein
MKSIFIDYGLLQAFGYFFKIHDIMRIQKKSYDVIIIYITL